MAQSFKGILFDLDGTLLDTADDLGAALNHVLKQYQLPEVSADLYRPIASDGATGLLQLGFGDQYTDFDEQVLREEFLDYYENNIATHTKLYPGIESFLQQLDRQSIPWGIVTNKPIALTKLLLPHFSAFSSSKVNLGGDSLSTRKPHPEPLIHACQYLSVAKEECIYLGDAPRDITAANEANMFSVVARWGYIKAEQKVDTWPANSHCFEPAELLALFE